MLFRSGDYDTLMVIPAPQSQELLGLQYRFQTDSLNSLNAEVVYNKSDVNTLSTRDKGNDEGYAFLIQGCSSLLASQRLLTESYLDVVNSTFRGIERFRSVEFDRDWNRNGMQIQKSLWFFRQALKLGFKERTSYARLFYEHLEDVNYWKGRKWGIESVYSNTHVRYNIISSDTQTKDVFVCY